MRFTKSGGVSSDAISSKITRKNDPEDIEWALNKREFLSFFFFPMVISFEEPSRRSLCSSPVCPNHSHSDKNEISLSLSHLSKALEKSNTSALMWNSISGRCWKRSMGKFFVLKIDLVYFDLGALFQIPRLSLTRSTGPDKANSQWLYLHLKAKY